MSGNSPVSTAVAPLTRVVNEAIGEAAGIQAHGAVLGEAVCRRLREDIANVQRRLDRHTLVLAIVGEKKAGKSTFLNAILGDRVLSAAARECTGTVTRLSYGPEPDFTARLTNGTEVRFKPEGDDVLASFRDQVRVWTDVAGRGADVVELDVRFPSPRLPADLVLLDTPGVNTDHDLHRERAWAAIRADADGCILLSDLQQAMSQSTRDFVAEAREVVPHVLLVLTKVDKALANATGVGGDDPDAQIAEATRIAVKRFAKEIGREPGEILALAVAAEPALAGVPAANVAFQQALDTLMGLLQTERALVLAMRAAGALEASVAAIASARQGAEASYQHVLDGLQGQQVADPAAFRTERLAEVKDLLERALPGWVDEVTRHARVGLARRQARWEVALMRGANKEDVIAAARKIAAGASDEIAEVLSDARTAGGPALDAVVSAARATMLQELRQRYQLAKELVGYMPADRLLNDAMTPIEIAPTAIAASLAGTISTFEDDAMQIGLGGIAAGALVGTYLLPGIGTAFGAMAGVVAGFLMSADVLRADCQNQLAASVKEAEAAMGAAFLDAAPAVGKAAYVALAKDLDGALGRFASDIGQLIAEQQRRQGEVRAALSDLQARGAALDALVVRLREGRAAAVAHSRGLCAPHR